MKPNDVDEKSLQLSELIFLRFAFDENLLAQRIEVCWRMLETIQTFSSKAFYFYHIEAFSNDNIEFQYCRATSSIR